MDTSKIIKGVVNSGRYTVTAPIVKEDYGLYLQIEGVELPQTYEVDFSNSEHSGTSVTMIGNSDGVLIPSQFISSGKDVFAFLYHVGANYGRTVYKFRIPNKVRPDRTEEQPTPEEQSVIDQAIGALNEAVAQTAQDVIDADASAQSASADADRAENAKVDSQNFATQASASASQAGASATSAEQSAEMISGYKQVTLSADVYGLYLDGNRKTKKAETISVDFSAWKGTERLNVTNITGIPILYRRSVTDVPIPYSLYRDAEYGFYRFAYSLTSGWRITSESTTATLTITAEDADGNTYTFEKKWSLCIVQDGADGQDGYSPTISVTDITGGHEVAITDEDGTKTFDVMDGDDYILTEQDKADIADTVAEELEPTLYDVYPTDTASGAVAHFEDGTENIPMKSIRIDTSETSGKVIRTGKNLIPYPYRSVDGTYQNVTRVTNADGSVTFNGVASANSYFNFVTEADEFAFKAGSYILSANTVPDDCLISVNVRVNGVNSYNVNLTAGNTSVVFTPQEDGLLRCYVTVKSGATVNDWTVYPMLRVVNDTDDVYEQYNGNTYDVTIADGLVQEEIPTLYGVNNVWSDVGDVEVEYRADPDLYIQRKMPEAPVQDVQINGTSIVSDGVANVPIAKTGTLGVVKTHPDYGIDVLLNTLIISSPSDNQIKAGAVGNKPITVINQHKSVFYGLAKSAGDTTQSASSNAVGNYTEDAKSAISEMLGGSVSVSGTTPTIVAKSGIRYVCGEVATLDFTPSQTGICDVVFTSGSTPTVVTLPSTVKFPDGAFTAEADTTYEINILDGIYGAVMAWT